MNTNLQHHYKDRTPQETIKIITKFFNDRNIIIRQKNNIKSEIDTFSCTYSLWWNGHCIFSCNGKGMDEEYSKASCYGELYERFCYFAITNGQNIFLKNDIMNLRKERYHYNLHPKEKELDEITYFNIECIKDSSIFNTICGAQYNARNFAHVFSNDKLLGFPYKSLLDNTIKYQDFTKITQELGTTGLAAGNTLEEALVQGSSELFERIVVEKFFYEIQDKYYQININNLDEIYLNKFQKLIELNYKVFLYDLSYNFHLPVLLLIVYNPIYQTCFIKFGSHPIFNIALERCLTELFQGYTILPDDLNNIELEWYKLEDGFKYIKNTNTGLLANHNKIVIPWFIFNNENIEINEFNSKYFLYSKSYSNLDLLYQIKEIVKQNNFDFNYLDISISKDIYAIHVIPQQQLLSCRSRYNKFDIENIDFTEQQQNVLMFVYNFIYDKLNQLKNTEQKEYNNQELADNLNFLLNLLDKNFDNIVFIFKYINILLTNSIYDPYNLKGNNSIIDGYNNLLYLVINDISSVSIPVRDERQKLWNQYLLSLMDVDKDIKDNMYQLLQLDKNIFNNNNLPDLNIYLIYILYIYSFQKIYNSKEYKDFLNMLIQK